MKFLKHTVWSLIVASMMTACMGFDEINVDPDKTNRPTPGMLATGNMFGEHAVIGKTLGGVAA